MIRLAVAGCRRGRAFIPILKDAGFTLVGAMDPDRTRLSRFAKEAGLSPTLCFDRYDALLNCGAEAVLLASPMPNHAPQAIEALGRGIHVLSEVPAVISFDQCLRLREAVRASQSKYMMAENAVYTREALTVGAMAEAGLFGDLYYAEGEYLHDVRDSVIDDAGQFTWRKRWQMDRRGATYSTHAIAPPLQWMDDRVARVTATGTGSHVDVRFGGDDTCVMTCTTVRGLGLVVRTDLRSPRPARTSYYGLQGSAGCYEAAQTADLNGRISLGDKGGWKKLPKFEGKYLPDAWRTHRQAVKRSKHGGADFFTLLAFAGVCRGSPSPVDVYRALDWTLPGLVSELSVERGGIPVDVPDPRTSALDDAARAELDTDRFAEWVESVDGA